MNYDLFSICACSLGALAMLKGKAPVHITIKKPSGESRKMCVTYTDINGVGSCVCNNYIARP